MLYPVENEIRQVKVLNGIWKFKKESRQGQGAQEKWYEKPLTDYIEMPVPSSYNDITTDKEIRDHVGWVWYEREFFIPTDWQDKRMVLRFGSVTHHAIVYINGKEITRHKGGFMPFEAELGGYVSTGKNRLTVAVSNMLDHDCLPFGVIEDAKADLFPINDPESPALKIFPEGQKKQVYQFDFFNYSGIHRPVKIYTTPKTYIKDITVKTDISGEDGIVDYSIQIQGDATEFKVKLIDEDGKCVGESTENTDRIIVEKAHFWNVRAAYLYELEIFAGEDHYTLPIGIRTIKVTDKQFLVNGKPVYFKGFGKHEDSDIKGKGLDEALNVRDFELLKWLNANSFRTSHYPYSEEIMQMADRQGFLVIDEVPSVGMHFWGPEAEAVFRDGFVDNETLKHHKDVLTELYERDKNHPCVVMWCVANEAKTDDEKAVPYFTEVVKHIRELDNTRPIVNVLERPVMLDKVTHLFDVICINRYFSWYYDRGNLKSIYPKLTAEFNAWHEKYNKPVMITEYGADTIAGMHKLPETIFSEEYQIEYYKETNRALDSCDFVIGEHPWAFADFMTSFGLTRFDGNKKGIFTRQRQPKSIAFVLKERWAKKV